jgi:two-component system chemotaxis sensor kinase CheA
VIRLRAFHAGGQVNVEISEDGHGIDCEKIKAKALSRGLITAERASRMTERELTNLIFMPGFSTADKVTNVSGRGVGMDVVKTNVERIGGMVDVETRPGAGTLFRVKIPLTLAIIPAVIVTCGEERYAIPQISLLEIVHVGVGSEASTAIEFMHGTPVYRLRGQLLPLVNLGNVLENAPAAAAESLNIVVLSVDNKTFGLVVDGVHDTADIVVKPMGAHLKGIPAFAGATILGDGSVALILDVLGLAKTASVVGEERGAGGTSTADVETRAKAEEEALLLCQTESDGRVAVRLSLVSRLEKIPAKQVERVGDEEVVQYRGEVMPLVRLSSLLPDRMGGMGEPKEVLDVVVHSAAGRSVGLVVDQVLDIVHQEVVLARRSTRSGVVGSIVSKGRVTELLDLEALLGITSSALDGGSAAFEAA